MNKSVYVPIELYNSKKLTPEEMTLFFYYSLNFSENDAWIAFDYQTIGYQIFERIPTRSELQKIINATEGLKDKGFIKSIKKIGVNKVVIYFDYIKYSDDQLYIKLDNQEFFKIMKLKNTDKKINMFGVFDSYLAIINSMDGSKTLSEKFRFKICNATKDALIMNSQQTDYQFNQSLKLLKERCVLESIPLVDKERQIAHNIISKYEDRDALLAYCHSILNKDKQYIGNEKAVNTQRQVTSLYNQMVKKGAAYPFCMAKQVLEFVYDYELDNPDQDKYDVSALEKYITQLAYDFLYGKANISKRTLEKYKSQLPSDYDDLKDSKQYLLDSGLEDADYLSIL